MIMGITDELWITPVVLDRCSDLNFSRENHPCVSSGLLDLLHYANNFTNFCNYGEKQQLYVRLDNKEGEIDLY